jgi:Protein of unknown function (DUF3309)
VPRAQATFAFNQQGDSEPPPSTLFVSAVAVSRPFVGYREEALIALLGGFSGLGGGPFYGAGYYGGGGLGLILVVVLILVLLGKL